MTGRICPKSKPGTFHLEKDSQKNALVTRPAGLLLCLLLLLLQKLVIGLVGDAVSGAGKLTGYRFDDATT